MKNVSHDATHKLWQVGVASGRSGKIEDIGTSMRGQKWNRVYMGSMDPQLLHTIHVPYNHNNWQMSNTQYNTGVDNIHTHTQWKSWGIAMGTLVLLSCELHIPSRLEYNAVYCKSHYFTDHLIIRYLHTIIIQSFVQHAGGFDRNKRPQKQTRHTHTIWYSHKAIAIVINKCRTAAGRYCIYYI